ncbi:MAG: TonB-dependent receptor [Lysobacteraceae bacterium]|nr:MAG: TonB-dependent receptor [Xanthomonadaceae bacterium]
MPVRRFWMPAWPTTQETSMSTLQVRPVCAAVMLLCAHVGLAAAQTTDPAPPAPESAAGPVATVTVSGIRGSIRSAEQIKRDSEQVVDSINADDIGKFPDRAVGDALQRVAGVQVGRDRGETSSVIIRGLPDVATTIEGNEMFTGTGRRLSYQDLPVQSIGGLDVYKSATANQFEGGIAGAVNIRLRAPFDFKGYTVTGFLEGRRNYVEGSEARKEKTNPGGGLLLSNRWQTGAGEVGVLVDLAYNKENWAMPVQWVDRPDGIFSVSPDGTAQRLYDGPIAPLRPGDRLGELPNIGGIYNAGDRERGSIHAAVQWKPNAQTELSAQYLGTGYSGRSEVDYILNIATWAPRLTNVVLAPQGDYCNTRDGVICPIQAASAAAARFGNPYDWDPYTATSTWGVKERTDTHFLNFGAKYRQGPLSVDSNLAFTRSDFINDTVIVDQQIPGASASVYTAGRDGHGGYNAITTPTSGNPLRDPNQFVLRGMVQNWGESRGEQAQFRLDSVYRLGDGFITALTGGIRLSHREVSFHSGERANDLPNATVRPSPVDAFGPSFQSLVPGLDRLGGPWMTPSRDFLIYQADRVRAFYGQPAGRVADDPMRLFEQRERTATLHLGARWKAELGRIGMTGNVGGRLVKVDRKLEGNRRIGDVVTPISEDSDETNFLPNVSAVVNWTERLQSHLSVGKTITRPEFAQLNPALSLIPPTVNAPGTGSSGNPELSPTESVNSDATLEYYFPDNGFVQVALFHRDIDGYLQNFEQTESINGVNYRVTRPQNSGKGKLKGAEFGIQKFFDFLPGAWSGLGAQFNYTWIDGENQTRTSLNSGSYTTTDIVGVARQSYNFALLYERGGWTGRLAATRRGKYVEQIAEPRFGQDRIVKASTYVDLSLGYALTPNLTLNFDAVNLTKERYESYIGDPIRPRDIRYNPTTYGLSLRYQM